ncbi:MAG: hypothetical protein KatS3mg109_2340 [Pirellulaceae bacterium]|nr:MAG: hypothetical protein KatS3mg109_2340 [Pirellulaceae bacterium]
MVANTGIELHNVEQVTVQQNQIGWIADPNGGSNPLPRPARIGIALTNVTTATLAANQIRLNADDGIQLTSFIRHYHQQ